MTSSGHCLAAMSRGSDKMAKGWRFLKYSEKAPAVSLLLLLSSLDVTIYQNCKLHLLSSYRHTVSYYKLSSPSHSSAWASCTYEYLSLMLMHQSGRENTCCHSSWYSWIQVRCDVTCGAANWEASSGLSCPASQWRAAERRLAGSLLVCKWLSGTETAAM